MTNAVDKPKTFEERMIDQFRENVGNLLSDEEMRKIIERGMETLFFKGETKKDSHYPYNTTELPPLAVKLAQNLLQESAERILLQWLNENKERFFAMMEKQMSSEALQSIMLQMFSQMFTSPIEAAHNNMRTKVINFAFQNNLNPGEL